MKKYLIDYETMHKNVKIIKEFSAKYYKERMILSGVVCELIGACSCDDYMKIVGELNTDENIGNYMAGLTATYGVERMKQVLDGIITFDEWMSTYLTDEGFKLYKKYMKKYA